MPPRMSREQRDRFAARRMPFYRPQTEEGHRVQGEERIRRVREAERRAKDAERRARATLQQLRAIITEEKTNEALSSELSALLGRPITVRGQARTEGSPDALFAFYAYDEAGILIADAPAATRMLAWALLGKRLFDLGYVS